METIISAVEKFITSRNSAIDLNLIFAIAVIGILAGTVSPLFFFPLALPIIGYLLRGYAHDKADRNAEEARISRERQREQAIRYMVQH